MLYIFAILLQKDDMDINSLLSTFEQRLRMQRYSVASIRNYKSAVDNFLRLASQKYQKPQELDADKIEKYVFWLIETKNISASYQRMVAASRNGGLTTVRAGTKLASSHCRLCGATPAIA